MAYLNQTNRSFGLLSALDTVVAKVGAAVSDLAETWRRARIHRETYAQLDALSDRELEDIGLSRIMISRVAYEAAYGPKA